MNVCLCARCERCLRLLTFLKEREPFGFNTTRSLSTTGLPLTSHKTDVPSEGSPAAHGSTRGLPLEATTDCAGSLANSRPTPTPAT